jgi:plasmid stabilization system protein ParE
LRIEWFDSAAENIDAIADYLDPINPGASRRTLSRIDAAVARLEGYPFVGRPGRDAGTRELVVARTPYVAIYAIEADCVAIHGAQQWPPGEE